jgi:Holliday junction resolvase RusA-like endonuclease
MKKVFEIDDDQLLVEFEVEGHPVPHSFDMRWVPNLGGRRDANGKSGRHIPNLNPALKAWQAEVRSAARKAMGYAKPFDAPVFVSLEFMGKPRNGEPEGTPWTTPVKASGAKQDRTIPDLDNLAKAAIDGIAGVVLANDVTVTKMYTSKNNGPRPGVKMSVYAL